MLLLALLLMMVGNRCRGLLNISEVIPESRDAGIQSKTSEGVKASLRVHYEVCHRQRTWFGQDLLRSVPYAAIITHLKKMEDWNIYWNAQWLRGSSEGIYFLHFRLLFGPGQAGSKHERWQKRSRVGARGSNLTHTELVTKHHGFIR